MDFFNAADTRWMVASGNRFLYQLNTEDNWQERAALMRTSDKSCFNKESVHKLLAALRRGERFCGPGGGISGYVAGTVATITKLFVKTIISEPLFKDFPPQKARPYHYIEDGKILSYTERELIHCERAFLRSYVLAVLQYRCEALEEFRRSNGDFQCRFDSDFVRLCGEIRREHCGNEHTDSSIYENRAKEAGFNDVILYRIVDGLLQRIIAG